MRRKGIREFGGGFLLLCMGIALFFGYHVMKPFLFIFLFAFVLATLSYPFYSWLLSKTKNRTSLASLLTCAMIVLLIILPSFVLLGLLAQESIELYTIIEKKVSEGALDPSFLDKLLSLQRKYLPQLDLGTFELGKSAASVAGKVSSFLVSSSASILKNVSSAIINFFLTLFTLYYFLKDGPAFLRWVMHISPLPSSYEKEIFQRFKGVSESAFYGAFLTALCQGFLGGVGFWIVGLKPLIWGVAMAFFSLIPLVGTALIWGPGAAYLLIEGKTVSGIFLIFWGILAIGMVDNILRPILMKGKTDLHPLLIFFSILGGISAFGLFGILLGPLAMALCVVFLQVYQIESKSALDELDNL